MDGRAVRLAQPRRRFDQRIEHHLQIEGRAADDLEHVGGRGLLLQRFGEIVRALPQLAQQARILDRDDGLGGEVRDQLDLLVGEWPHLLPVDGNAADQLVLLEHRHVEIRPGARKPGEDRGSVLVRQQVGDVNDLLRRDQAPERGLWTGGQNWLAPPFLKVCRRRAVLRNAAECVSLI